MFELQPPKYTREAITSTDELFALATETVAAGKLVAVVNDFDGTVSQVGPSNGINPFDTILHPHCGAALARIENEGGIIGAISNRSGGQIIDRYKGSGVNNLFAITTYGFELCKPSPENDKNFQSEVDKRFQEYAKPITEVLGLIQRVTLNEMVTLGMLRHDHRQIPSPNPVEITVHSNPGPLYLENKASGAEEFPHGLAAVYNFNEFEPEERRKLVDKMKAIYEESMQTVDDHGIHNMNELRKIWGISKDSSTPQEPGRYSFAIEPLIRQGKALGSVQLLRTIKSSGLYNKPIGLLIYGGDDEIGADRQAMRANRILEHTTYGLVKTVGIWVDPGKDPEAEQNLSDIRVKGVDEYAKILDGLADSMKK